MNATNRRLAIFDKLLNEKRVVVMNLAEEFNVTPMTIRRDLSVLEKQGVITTYYGGASLNEGAASEPSFMLKNKNAIDEKMAIAYEASKLINEGDSVYIDCGTTCYNIGRFLKNKKITVLAGDGIGPEIVAEAIKALNKVAEKFGHTFAYTPVDIGGCSIDKFGVPITEEGMATAADLGDALLARGAVSRAEYEEKQAEAKEMLGV